MKILFTLRFFPAFGGGEAVTLSLANALCRRGYNVYILYLWENYAGMDVNVDDMVKTIKVRDIHLPINGFEIDKRDYAFMKSEFISIVNKHNINIVMNQWWPEKLIYGVTSAKIIKCHHTAILVDSKRKETLRKIFGDNGYSFILKQYLKKKYKATLKLCDKFVLLSPKYIDDVRYLYGNRYNKKLYSISNPCRYDLYENCYRDKENIALFVGRLSTEKRVALLLDSWRLFEKENHDWKLHIVGDGLLINSLIKYSKDIGCEKVSFLGSMDPMKELKKAKIIVMTSSYEGLPMSIIEGMNFGCVPIVMNTFSACSDIVTCGKDGILVNDSVMEFSRALVNLVSNEDMLRRMSLEASKKSARYTIDHIIDEWIKCFSIIEEELHG